MSKPPLGFIPEPITLALDRILAVPQTAGRSAGIAEVQADRGLDGSRRADRTLSVGKADKKTGQHILLDGHHAVAGVAGARLHRRAVRLIATDDESYTYNNRINRISSIRSTTCSGARSSVAQRKIGWRRR